MRYDALKRRVKAYKAAQQAEKAEKVPVLDCIAPVYHDLYNAVQNNQYQTFNLPGGRGSAKSTFVATTIVDGIPKDPNANAIVFRQVADTLRESVFNQIGEVIDRMGVSHLWKANVSPLRWTYTPTGQQILFRGLDDPQKMKSVKVRHGFFKFVWFEEFSELTGPNAVRSVRQSVIRGGTNSIVFNSFNPPLSLNNWANQYVLLDTPKAITFRTTYLDIPREWLGQDFIDDAEQLKAINENAYRHEYLGEPTGSGGEVFPHIETRTITDEEIASMDYFKSGVDFGFSSDPAVYLLLSYDRKKETIYFIGEIYRKHCSNAELAEAIKEAGFDKIGNKPSYSPLMHEFYDNPVSICCDAAEPKSIADLRGMGLDCYACKKYPGSVLYGIKWLQRRHLVIDPARTPNAYREFTGYEYETTKDGEFLASVPDANNHTIDSCRYAFDLEMRRNDKSA